MNSKQSPIGSAALMATIVLGALAGLGLAQPAMAASSCDLADLDGTFSFVVHGTDPAGQPFGAVGVLTADGEGNIDGVRISVENGVPGSANFTCAYSMSPDCLFRGPCIDDGEAVAEVRIDGALADGGRELMLVLSGIPAVAGGAVVTGVAREQ